MRFRRRHRSAAQGVVAGGIIVVVGMLLLLNNMHIIRMRDAWDFWPLILVVFGFARIFESRSPSSLNKIWGGIMAGAGVLLLLDNLNMFSLNVNFVWPLVLIGFGVVMLLKALDRQRLRSTAGAMGTDGTAAGPTLGERFTDTSRSSTLAAVFSGGKRRITTPDFRGMDLLALFGGLELDLRGARVEVDQAVIDVNAMFGGVKITVPDNWTVDVKGFGMFGAFEDKTIPARLEPNVKTQHLVVTGVCIFGGAVVCNGRN